MSVRRWRGGRGVLALLAIMLASSGALRLGAGVGAALARAPALSAEPLVCPDPPLALVEALNAREAQVKIEEAALADRLAALALADEAIQSRLSALSEAEAELSETLARADGAAEADLARLTTVYEAMKAKDAALLFGVMAPDFAAGFLGRMRPESAAAILAGMDAKSAYAVSVLLAGRNAKVPTE